MGRSLGGPGMRPVVFGPDNIQHFIYVDNPDSEDVKHWLDGTVVAGMNIYAVWVSCSQLLAGVIHWDILYTHLACITAATAVSTVMKLPPYGKTAVHQGPPYGCISSE